MDQPPAPQPPPPPPKKPLFDGVVYLLSPTLPPLRADQLRLVLNTKGGVEVLPPSSLNGSASGGTVTPLSSRAEYRNENQAAREALADPRLTHVVTNTLNNCEEGWRDVLLTREEKVAVVTDLWVDKSVALDSVQPTAFYSADPFMIFSGVVACASELPATDLEVLSAGITALGGQWRTGLTKDVTHLFCISPGTPPPNLQEIGTFEHVGSLKYATALKNQHTTCVKVLLPHWFDDIMKIGMPGLDTKPYEWPDPELLKGPESILLPGVDGPESLKVNEKMKEREKEREERMKKDSVLREEDTFKKSLYATAGLVSPGAALPSDVSMNGDADSAQGVKPKDIWKGRRVLLGRSLELLDSRREAVEAGLRRTGAVIVSHSPSASSAPLSLRKLDTEREKELIEECDVFVTRFRSGKAYASAVRLGKMIGTLSWLFHVQKTGVVSPPMDQLLWYPIPKRKIEGFDAHEITLTNYTGEAREYLKKLITIMGANFTPSMSGRNTVLIAAYISGTKTTKAASWSIPIVNHLWLEDCFIKWRNLTPALERYIHFPPGIDFSNLLGERGIGKRVEDEMGDEELDQLEAEEDEEFGVKPPESRTSQPRPNGAPLNTQNSMREVMEVEAAISALDVPMEDAPEMQQEREQEQAHDMEVDEPAPELEPKSKDPPKPANGITKSFATRLKEKVLEKDKDSESPAKTRIRPRKSSAQKKFSLDSSSSSRSPSPQPSSPMQASTSKKKLTRRAGEKHDSWIRDEDDRDEVQVVSVKLSPKKAPSKKRNPKDSETEDEEIVQATSSPAKLFDKGEDDISDGDPSQPKRKPYSPKKYKSQTARRRSNGAQEEEEEEQSADEEVSPTKSAGKGKAAQSTSAVRRRGAKQLPEDSATEEEESEEEQPKPRPRGRHRDNLPTRDEEEEEEEEPAKPTPKPRGRPKKAAKQIEEDVEEEEKSPQKKTKGHTPKKLPDIRELTDSEDDMPPATSVNMLSKKKAPAKPTPPKAKGKAPKKKETPLPPESEEEDKPPPASVKIGPPRGKKKLVPTATTTTKKAKTQTSDAEDEDLHQSSPTKTPNRATVVLTDRHSSKKKMAADENPPSRKNTVGKTESILVTAGERAGPLAKAKAAQVKDSPKSRPNVKKAEDSAPSSPLTAMEVDDDVSTPATESGRSKRTAATKATKKLHDEIMPDVLNYQHEVKQDKRRKSLGLPPSVGSFESQKGKKKREAEGEEEDAKEGREKKKRKMEEEQEEEPVSAKSSKSKQKEAKAETSGYIDAGIRLMTTQVNLSDEVIKALTKLGVKITSRPSECTHLLVPHLVRTEKFLCALAQAPFIMKEAWAKDSAAQKKLLDEKPYLLRDKANEAKYEFVLSEALQRAKEHKESGGLFLKKTFYVTPKVPVDKKLLKNVVESGGGTMSNQTPTPRIIGMNPEDRIVVSCPEDLNIWRPLASAGYPIYLSEIILASTLKQEIDWDNDAFKVAASK